MGLSRLGTTDQNPWTIRPTATVAIVYVGLLCVGFLWVLCTGRYAVIGAEPAGLVGDAQFLAVTATNVLLLAALAVDWRFARRGPPGVRRGAQSGILLAALCVVLAQVALIYAHAPPTG